MPDPLWLVLGLAAGTVFLVYARSYAAEGEKRVLAIALVVVAATYTPFGALWSGVIWFLIELSGTLVFGAFAWAGIRRSADTIAPGWLLHPAWDGALHLLGRGKIVAPEWYATACITFDLVVAGYVLAHQLSARPTPV